MPPLEAGFVILGLKDGKAFIVTTGTQSMAFEEPHFRVFARAMTRRVALNQTVKRGLANVARSSSKRSL